MTPPMSDPTTLDGLLAEVEEARARFTDAEIADEEARQ